MAITIPASDIQGTYLNNTLTNIGTLMAANPQNVSLINQQYQAQLALAIYLLSNGYIAPSVVIGGSGATYIGSAGIQGV